MLFEIIAHDTTGQPVVYAAGDTDVDTVTRWADAAAQEDDVAHQGVALDGNRGHLWAAERVTDALAGGTLGALVAQGLWARWLTPLRDALTGWLPEQGAEDATVSDLARHVGGETEEVRVAVEWLVSCGVAEPVNVDGTRVRRSPWVTYPGPVPLPPV